MDAKEFLKGLKVPKRWRGEDGIGDWLYYEKGVIEAMEQYHQSKVNNGVLDDVSNSFDEEMKVEDCEYYCSDECDCVGKYCGYGK